MERGFSQNCRLHEYHKNDMSDDMGTKHSREAPDSIIDIILFGLQNIDLKSLTENCATTVLKTVVAQ